MNRVSSVAFRVAVAAVILCFGMSRLQAQAPAPASPAPDAQDSRLSMNKRTIIISYLLLALLTALQAVLAQTGSGSNRDWAAVMTLQPGEKLAVRLKNGQTVEGKLSSVSESGLALARGDNTSEINREDTQRVYRIAGTSPKRPTLIGATIGAAGGAGLGATAGNCKNAIGPCFNRSTTIPLGAAVGAGVGALVGLAIGKARHKRTLVYEAK